MIGEIRKILTLYYDKTTKRQQIKSRPGLVIAAADSGDYVVLPISKVSDSRRIDPEYDIRVDPAVYTNLNLTCISYVRTHKQTTAHFANIGDKISDMRSEYEGLYLDILAKREEFSNEITRQAMGI